MHGSATQPRSPAASLTRSVALVAVSLLLLVCPAAVDAAFYSSQKKAELRQQARETWFHAYDSYKRQFGAVSPGLSPPQCALTLPRPPPQIMRFRPTNCCRSPAPVRVTIGRIPTMPA